MDCLCSPYKNMEKLSFKLEVFEGPLDLLLRLITKNKVNIYDIPIASITDQYIETIEMMREMDLDVSSEFTVMASQLLLIKSRMLLPKNEEDDEEDPRGELVEKLLEYQRYKATSAFLKEREFSYRYMIFKKPIDIDPIIEPDNTVYPVDRLLEAFNDILERSKRRVPPPRKTFEGIVRKEKVSVKERIFFIDDILSGKESVMFSELFENTDSKPAMIATFLALLELIKVGVVKAEYNRKKEEFVILKTGRKLPEGYSEEKE